MNDAGYRKRLSADLPRWMDKGWVTPDNAAAILSSVGGGARAAFGVAAMLGTLGALLLGLGVIAFVAANWEEVPRLARFALLAAALFIAYLAAFEFERRRLRIFAEAAVLAAALVFAGSIALVGQSYHLAGDFEGALLLFEIGVLGAAFFTGSTTLAVVGLVAAGYWTWLGTVEAGIVPHWASLVAIAIGALVAITQDAHYSRIVAVLALIYWLAMTVAGFTHLDGWTAMGAAMLSVALLLALWSIGALAGGLAAIPRIAAFGEAILWPTLFVLMILLGTQQLVEKASAHEPQVLAATLFTLAVALVVATVAFARRSLAAVDLFAIAAIGVGSVLLALYPPESDMARRLAGGALVLVAAMWAVYQGQAGTHRIGKAFGLVAFGAEVIYLYVATLGTLLDTALGFLGGGVLFIVLAAVLYQIDKRLAARAGAASPDDVLAGEGTS